MATSHDRDTVNHIYGPIQDRLTRVENRLRDMANVDFPFLSELLAHVYCSSGKRVRPAITLLASNFHTHDHYKSEIMATAIELLHIATLIHDDTVDESDFRRGRTTISSMFGKDIAVLVGDYVFASSATLVCDIGHIGVIRRFSETIMDLSNGELRERISIYNPEQSIEDYYLRIYSKTASLFAVSGESAATISGATDKQVAALKKYAYELGMAFQIVDDILDFEGAPEEIGKPVGSDLAHGIMTLPTFIALERSNGVNPVKGYFEDRHNEKLLEEALEMVRQPEIMSEAYAEASRRCDVAYDALRIVPESPSRDSLESLLDYVVRRRR